MPVSVFAQHGRWFTGVRCRFWIAGLAVGLSLAALAAPVSAERVVVTTDDGRHLEGQLQQSDATHLVLDVAGIETRLDADRVAAVQTRDSRRHPSPSSHDRTPRLASANFAHALTLAQAAGQQRRAEEGPRRLSRSDINRIQVFEVDLDEEPRINIPRGTLNEFLDRYAGQGDVPSDRRERAQFLRAPGHEQLAAMFDVRAREYYGDVIVRDEPAALTDFRRRIHTHHVLNYCATNACHGGEDAPGNLQLLRGTDTDTVYTNFYILHSYENEDGYMIDRAQPQRSLLLQYALESQAARRPHPEVTGWQARFRDTNHREFERYAEIIDGLWRPAPDYGIDYHPPGMPEPEEGDDEDGNDD